MGYPKIWTSIMDEEWWEVSSGLVRSCYLQLLLLCKSCGDSGHLCYKNVGKLSILLSIDRRTMVKVLSFLEEKCCINVKRGEYGQLNIEVPNYRLYQDFDAKSHRKHIAAKRGDLGAKKRPTVNSKPNSKQLTVNSKQVEGPPSSNQENTAPDVSRETPEEVRRQIASSRASVKPPELTPLRQSFEDWRSTDTMWFDQLRMSETLKTQIKDIEGALSLTEFVLSFEGDLSHDVYNRPDKFKDVPDERGWRNLFKGYIRIGIKDGKMGNYGMKNPMSTDDERKHEAAKRRTVQP